MNYLNMCSKPGDIFPVNRIASPNMRQTGPDKTDIALFKCLGMVANETDSAPFFDKYYFSFRVKMPGNLEIRTVCIKNIDTIS